MAVLFLVSGMGITMSRMSCLKSGKTRVAFHELKDCCAKKSDVPVAIKENCCDIKTSSLKLANFQSSQKGQLKPVVVGPFQYNEFSGTSLKPHTISPTKEKIPIPKHGRQLLSFISILTI
jgi:hypothetical protein